MFVKYDALSAAKGCSGDLKAGMPRKNKIHYSQSISTIYKSSGLTKLSLAFLAEAAIRSIHPTFLSYFFFKFTLDSITHTEGPSIHGS